MSDWRDHAACIGEPYETFFGPDDAGPGQGATWVPAAKKICATCPVTEPCLIDALDNVVLGVDVGIRGGLSAKDRRAIRSGDITVADALARERGRQSRSAPTWRPPKRKRPTTCSVNGCDEPIKAYGWCHAHYMRWRRTGSASGDLPVQRRSA